MEILGTNVRVGRLEIDIVAREADTVIVVEVRTRGTGSWQTSLQSIDGSKAARVRRAGERLWRTRFERDRTVNRMRFDVAAVTFNSKGDAVVEHARGVL
jgi:putative endonuclease